MIDLHCHILPATDDGPTALAESLQLARLAHADGITDIIATPHHHRSLPLLRADILPRVEHLQGALQEAGIAVRIWPGSEIQVRDIQQYRANYNAGVLCHLGDRPGFTLWEWPWDEMAHPEREAEVAQVRWLLERGTQPIIAHPERHAFFRDDLPRLDALAQAGAWIQITAGSIFGHHGAEPQAASSIMLRRYCKVVLATDSHNLARRSGLCEAYAWIAQNLGPESADKVQARANSVLQRLRASESS